MLYISTTAIHFYINNMIFDFHLPHTHTLANRKIPALIYANDTVILSKSPVSLRRALQEFSLYCNEKQLELNYQKLKIILLGKALKLGPGILMGTG